MNQYFQAIDKDGKAFVAKKSKIGKDGYYSRKEDLLEALKEQPGEYTIVEKYIVEKSKK